MEHKQIVITEFGEASVLAVQHAPTPSPQSGEVLVKVSFSGINPIDVKTRAGLGWAAAQTKTICLGFRDMTFQGKSYLVESKHPALLLEIR